MVTAGIAWGAYSLRGRSPETKRDPRGATAKNFAFAVPFAIVVSAIMLPSTHLAIEGVGFAVASGAIASGIGYSLWYAALPSLTAARAGIVQLAVPVVAALGGIIFFGEQLSVRLVLATCAILGGIGLATLKRA